MTLDSVRGQEHAAELFRRILSGGRLGHAYAFAGPEGVGKARFALELSKALLCREKPGEGCDTCRTCLRVERKTHPDVHWYSPPKERRIFPISVIREGLIRDISLKAFESDRKVFILERAEMMSEEAANCLLKTLEEPPENSLLILITDAVDRLLPTIYSRCLVVRFRPVAPEVMEPELKKQLGVDDATAAVLARMSCGSFGRARALHESGGIEAKNDFIEMVRSMKFEDDFEAAGRLISAAPSGETMEVKRSYLKQLLDFLLFYYRDFLVSSLTGDDGMILNRDRAEEIARLARSLSPDMAERAAGAILQAEEYLLMNINMNLLLEDLFHKLCGEESPAKQAAPGA